jgi:hypothetical protein
VNTAFTVSLPFLLRNCLNAAIFFKVVLTVPTVLHASADPAGVSVSVIVPSPEEVGQFTVGLRAQRAREAGWCVPLVCWRNTEVGRRLTKEMFHRDLSKENGLLGSMLGFLVERSEYLSNANLMAAVPQRARTRGAQ